VVRRVVVQLEFNGIYSAEPLFSDIVLPHPPVSRVQILLAPKIFVCTHLKMDPKWTGTADDKRKMRRLGLKQVVRVSFPSQRQATLYQCPQRNFGYLPLVGLASTVIASWETIAM
jgi:hypothetical protein